MKSTRILKIVGSIILVFILFFLIFQLPWLSLLLAAAGLWYFTEKQPDKKKRNIAAVVAAVSLLGALMPAGEREADPETQIVGEQTDVASSVASSDESISESEKEAEELAKAEAKEKEEKEAAEKAAADKAKEAEEKAKAESRAEAEAKRKEEAAKKEAEAAAAEKAQYKELLAQIIVDDYHARGDSGTTMTYHKEYDAFFILPVSEDLKNAMILAVNGILPIETWDNLVSSFVSLSESISDVMGPGHSLILVNPVNQDLHLLFVMDGVVIYDVMDQ